MPELSSHAIALPVERGCGSRKAGGIYVETGFSNSGSMDWLIDPPQLLPQGLPAPTQGMGFLERNGVIHLVDWVGAEYYPTPAHFIEEAWRFGVSRRIQRNFPLFRELTAASRLLLIHRKAYLANWQDYEETSVCRCPKCIPSHGGCGLIQRDMCVKSWWEDMPDTAEYARLPYEDYQATRIVPARYGDSRLRMAKMPSFSFLCRTRPPHIQPQHQAAIFASLPIHTISVVQDDGGRHVSALEVLEGIPLPFALVEH